MKTTCKSWEALENNVKRLCDISEKEDDAQEDDGGGGLRRCTEAVITELR
jgi:hypothetical protein